MARRRHDEDEDEDHDDRDDHDHDEAPPPSGGGAKIVIIVLVAVFVVGICIVGILATLLMPALMKAKDRANRTRCGNNLRQVALSGIIYADEKRFYPHVGPTPVLDGGIETNHTPRALRTLVWMGFVDDAEAFVCPSATEDLPAAMIGDGKSWGFEGPGNPDLSPILDEQTDPALVDTHALSYGWTRRGLNANTRSNVPLLADRALFDGEGALGGNHAEGWNVAQADGSVEFLDANRIPDQGASMQAWLVDEGSGGAALAIEPPGAP